MKTFKKHLNRYLQDPKFREMYNEEKELIELSLRLQEARRKAGIPQERIAAQARLTQQQLSKIEGGENCNIKTYLRASHAMGFRLTLKPIRRSLSHAN